MTNNSPVVISSLSCGATLLVEPLENISSVAYSILVPAGSIYEPVGQNGLAAVLADLITRGAGERDSRQLAAAFDQMGVQHSESIGWNFLTLSGALLAGHLGATLELCADILRRARLPEEEFPAAVLGVEQSLRAMQDEPHRQLFVELRRSCFDDPWGRNPEGTLEEIPALTYEDLVTHFQRGVRPNGAIIGVAGAVDPDRCRAWLDQALTGWESVKPPTLSTAPRQPPVRHIPHDSAQTHIGLAWNAVPYGHEDYYAAWAAANILGGGSSSRLFTEVRERRGLCYSVSAMLNSLVEEARTMVYVGTTTERAQETLDVTVAEIRRMQEGVTSDELERCKASAKSSLVMQQESAASRASAIARDWFQIGRVKTLEEIRQQLDVLSPEDVTRYVRNHPAENLVVITAGRAPLDIPSL